MLSKNKPEISLKRAFIKRFFWGALIAWLIVALASYNSTRHEIDELYDGEMAQIARVLLGIYSSQLINQQQGTQITSSPFEGGDDYENKLVFQIWDENGRLLMRSANAPLEPLAAEVGIFQTRDVYGNEVRTLSIEDPGGHLIVHVGQNIEIRRENATEILETLIYIMLLAFPVFLWLIHKGVNQGTRFLNDLSEKIARRTEDDLSPIETDDVPLEIRGIVDALNKLMSKVNAMLGRERQFISDASHELRTPLAGIKAHAQLALKDKGHEQIALNRIVEGVDRTTRLANQLLTLSSIDAMNGLEKPAEVDLRQLIERVIEDLHTEIDEKSIQITTQFDTEKQLLGNEDLLYTLLRNLIENAVRYSSPESEVKVLYQWNKQALSVSIIDQGPGIPADQLDRVFDRFYRDINAEGNGSGLGLAIARQIASLHGAKIALALTETGQGLSVTVNFDSKQLNPAGAWKI
jgi:two-component system sensor histidine kinase QseC